ncbi:helix-turn-helix domain-containing protein [Thalassotalea marina]|uniref:HTH araC/xylS-type domain-containing protein n=1 Tax=Thalassotalea marina TaxID=1673741 RepID=A0A919BK92_9GAMM|nr:AraC family transcriptional regulator [Thalassotalea marina]GHF94767.1 hypothetical protein GCM10017161_23800 [Thalassotalea marina]
MIDPIVMIVTMLIVGQIAVSVPILFAKANKSALNLPLAIFLVAIGALALNPIIASMAPNWYALYTALAFPALFMLCPSLWFYVEGLTADTKWQLQKKQAWHFILVAPALIISVMILMLPKETHTAIFIDDTEVSGWFVSLILVSMLIMMLLWLSQCVYTLIKIVRRLSHYRKRLKDLFSNNENKELKWINWLLFIAVCTWIISLITVFSSSLLDQFLFNGTTEALFSLILIWSLIHFGMQQQPALVTDEISPKVKNELIETLDNNKNEQSKASKTALPTKKYQRSALSKEQSKRIADKINTVMQSEHLYLDASLSLHKLAQHLDISPNYISQTLNQTLTTNFFDFVNQWRIEAAKPKILANEATILDIALDVGFNARSSFYKAFKQVTGQTPSDFRKAHQT